MKLILILQHVSIFSRYIIIFNVLSLSRLKSVNFYYLPPFLRMLIIFEKFGPELLPPPPQRPPRGTKS